MKRTFHVCMSIGLNGYVEVEAANKREAKKLAKKLVVDRVTFYGPDDSEFEFGGPGGSCTLPEEYERILAPKAVIDLEEIGKPDRRKKR